MQSNQFGRHAGCLLLGAVLLLDSFVALVVCCTDLFPAPLVIVEGEEVACFLCSIFFNVAEESFLVDTGSTGAVTAFADGCLR